jgi:hypothetical protein
MKHRLSENRAHKKNWLPYNNMAKDSTFPKWYDAFKTAIISFGVPDRLVNVYVVRCGWLEFVQIAQRRC